MLVSNTRSGFVAGSSLTPRGGMFDPFTVMINIFVTEFTEFSETFRENIIFSIHVVVNELVNCAVKLNKES